MNTQSLIRLAAVFAGLSSIGFAQLVIPSGTKVTCRLDQALSSATAQEGQAVNLSVTEDVRIDDAVVIKQGATVFGTVVMAQEKRRMGRAGKLDFSIEKVRAADGEFIPLRYTPYKKNGEGKGVTTGVLTAGAAIVFWPAAPVFLLMKGKDVTVNKGITVDVFTDADHTMKSASRQQLPAVTSMAPAGDPVAITIESDVDGAEVEVDGAFVGSAPVTRRLMPGSHKVTVRDGSQVWERTVMVQSGETMRLKARFPRQAAAVRR